MISFGICLTDNKLGRNNIFCLFAVSPSWEKGSENSHESLRYPNKLKLDSLAFVPGTLLLNCGYFQLLLHVRCCQCSLFRFTAFWIGWDSVSLLLKLIYTDWGLGRYSTGQFWVLDPRRPLLCMADKFYHSNLIHVNKLYLYK